MDMQALFIGAASATMLLFAPGMLLLSRAKHQRRRAARMLQLTEAAQKKIGLDMARASAKAIRQGHEIRQLQTALAASKANESRLRLELTLRPVLHDFTPRKDQLFGQGRAVGPSDCKEPQCATDRAITGGKPA